jgi:hypothetical protein
LVVDGVDALVIDAVGIDRLGFALIQGSGDCVSRGTPSGSGWAHT